MTGVVAEKAFGAIRLFVNFENIFDTRQTRWDPIVAGGYDAVSYRPVPVYAPLEGRVVNGALVSTNYSASTTTSTVWPAASLRNSFSGTCT